ncbi:MAG: SH3 domain-containing protein [Ruminococcus flavefaciens]|nr:SH3 domain-containing protein [Ruminococcus flavefaciens]MCM1228895.1 SH3 domain-containing protein [Ruminococcus flavefaciens]
MKKTLVGLLALTLTVSGVLCGCSNSKENEDISGDTVSSDGTDSAEDSDKTFSLSIFDNIYADYIRQQKLCTISNDFKILEVGTARDNPNGLAGAVKYDFNGDKVDDLVTFTFERNDTNGEDIRINLLEIEDGKAKVKDSCYLTDILDMDFLYDYQKGNTIYYSELAELQIVQSEYNGQLYFGVLLKEADYLGGLSLFNTKYSVFTVRDGKIETQAIGTVIDEAVFNLSYAKQIPESMSNIEVSDTACVINDKNTRSPESAEQEKARIDEMTVDSEKYNLFTNSHSFDGSYQIEGGAYDSKPQAFSAMLNGFGLDIDDAYNQSHYSFVSKNQSEVKTIIQIEQLQPFARSGDTEYLGVKLTLDSDLEELLENESPFKESFADEIALYEDIMRYPYYYHDIWDTYVNLDDAKIQYCVVDINNDDCKELIITGNRYDMVCNVSIVNADLTIYNMEWAGTLNIYNNGTITVAETGSAYVPVHYYSLADDSQWLSCNQKQEDNTFINAIWQENTESEENESLEGEEAEAKISELCSGTRLIPEFNSYYLNSFENFRDIVFVDDASEIEYTWQKAYIKKVDDSSGDSSQFTDTALLYINDDDIPEIYVQNYSYKRDAGFIYSYKNGTDYEMGRIYGLRMEIGGYKEKGNMYYSNFSENVGNIHGHEFYKVENGYSLLTNRLAHYMAEDEYYIDDEKVDEKTYNQKFEELTQDMDSTPKILSYDDIMEKLNSNDTFEPDKLHKEKNDTKENTEKDTDVSSVMDNQVMTVKANGGLNLRDGAGKEYKKITLIPDGSEVSVLEKQEDWTKVQYNDYIGWVSSDYLF